MTYRVYLIENLQARRYIGISSDVPTRLDQHNRGESRWTAKFRPWTIKWTSREFDLTQARKLETLMKKQKGGSVVQCAVPFARIDQRHRRRHRRSTHHRNSWLVGRLTSQSIFHLDPESESDHLIHPRARSSAPIPCEDPAHHTSTHAKMPAEQRERVVEKCA